MNLVFYITEGRTTLIPRVDLGDVRSRGTREEKVFNRG